MNVQPFLFDDETTGSSALVQVAVVGSRKALSRAQKTFNRLTGKIEDQRRRLAEWQAFAQSFGSRLAGELQPVERRLDEQRRALLRCFAAAHDGGELTRREQGRLARIICERAAELLDAGDDPELLALHDKYSDVSHDDLRRGQIEALKAMTEAALGMPFDEDEIRTPDDLIDAVRRRIEEGAGQDARHEPDAPGMFDREAGAAQAGRDRPASARASARLERERAAIEGATRSVREVYRKLASALHPDRESDPVERDRKTVLMQRANQAYEARELLQLLALQIEVEQIDLNHLAAIGDDRLAHYNRVLKEQSVELDQAIEDLIGPFARSLSGRVYRDLTPAIVIDAFQREVADLRRESAWMMKQLDAFRNLRMLKAWLRTQPVGRAPSPDPFDTLERLVATLPGDIEAPAKLSPRRGGRRKSMRR